MKVEVLSLKEQDCVVNTKFGILKVKTNDKFEINKSYYVDVDFKDTIDCNKQMFSDDKKESVIADGESYIINAELLTVGDGILTVMIDKGFASIDATNLDVLENARHKFIKFKVSKIYINIEELS